MLSRDEALNQIFASGMDFHTMAAATLFGVSEDGITGEQRTAAKQATYAAMYGGTSDLMSNMSSAFPQFFRWREAQKSQVLSVYT
jgi:DNA polymerase I-like protein with 3'-5' exonuclease and polymerase domains